MAEHNELGKKGEELACEYLQQEGYAIIDHDYQTRHRDIDIVAMNEDGTTLVFVEVKTRSNDGLMRPEQAVDRQKIIKLGRAANVYIHQNHPRKQVRFDIIAIVWDGSNQPQIRHIKNAFNPMLVR